MQQKTKKIIKDIINPAPSLLINDTFNQQEDANIDTQKNTDNTYKLKPNVQKQLNNTILKNFALLPVTQPIPPPPYQILIRNNYLQLKTFLLTMS